jgi:hypothetical protein
MTRPVFGSLLRVSPRWVMLLRDLRFSDKEAAQCQNRVASLRFSPCRSF